MGIAVAVDGHCAVLKIWNVVKHVYTMSQPIVRAFHGTVFPADRGTDPAARARDLVIALQDSLHLFTSQHGDFLIPVPFALHDAAPAPCGIILTHCVRSSEERLYLFSLSHPLEDPRPVLLGLESPFCEADSSIVSAANTVAWSHPCIPVVLLHNRNESAFSLWRMASLSGDEGDRLATLHRRSSVEQQRQATRKSLTPRKITQLQLEEEQANMIAVDPLVLYTDYRPKYSLQFISSTAGEKKHTFSRESTVRVDPYKSGYNVSIRERDQHFLQHVTDPSKWSSTDRQPLVPRGVAIHPAVR